MTPSDVEQQRQRILNMEAGLELNVLISEQVFGWERIDRDGLPPYWLTDERHADRSRVPANSASIPPYSTEAGAAWLVVEALPGCCTSIERENVAGVRYDVTINLDENHTRTFHVMADTMPLAVARCALLATLEARPR